MANKQEVTRFAYCVDKAGRQVRVEVPPGEEMPDLERTDISRFSLEHLEEIFPGFKSSD